MFSNQSSKFSANADNQTSKTSANADNQTSKTSANADNQTSRPPAVILFEYIGDRSGSTINISAAQMTGLQKCISDRKEDVKNTGAQCLVSITTFDDESETWTKNLSEDSSGYVDINSLSDKFSSEELDKMLSARGSTRLIDTAVERATCFEAKLKEVQLSLKGKENDKVVAVFVLSTDGMDNASSDYEVQDLNKIVTRLRKSGVEMMFLAANQDAIGIGSVFGFAASHSITFGANHKATSAVYNGLSQVTRDVSSGKRVGGFTNTMRQASAPVKHYRQSINTVKMPRSLKMSTCAPIYSKEDK
tara:strand:+ start:2712 stop:3623 length:912 start_codon:yes stop_codon:yes gene_type:complete